MREITRPAPPAEHSRAATASKRRHSQYEEESHRRRKRHRLVSKTETLTLIQDPSCNPPTLNRFDPVRCSNRTREKRKSRKSRSSRENYRSWTYSSRDFSTCKDKVVVVSYNILGVENTLKHPDLYLEVPRKFLEWDRRKELICKEINNYNASILCFQEVDRFNDLSDHLQKDGFKGVYKARTGEACDGCALFWDDRRFTLLHQENIEFQSFGLRDNVAQLCVLKMNGEQSDSDSCNETSMSPTTHGRCLLVGNIHVLFNPNRGDIKLGQVRLFLEKAYELSQEWGSIPVIIAGDLNSIPQSALYQFLSLSKLDIRLHDRRKISGQVEGPSRSRTFRSQYENAASVWISIPKPLLYRWSDEEVSLATGNVGVTDLQHQFKLCSAYFGVPGSCRTRDGNGEPLATSYHSKFMGTVDYIWHSEELVPVRVLETLPIDILRRTRGLPSEKWGSDHLSLVCELAFADDGNRN